MNITKQAKDEANRALDEYNFDVTRYEGCAGLDAAGWLHSLCYRQLCQTTLLDPARPQSISYVAHLFAEPLWPVESRVTPTYSTAHRFAYRSVVDSAEYSLMPDVRTYPHLIVNLGASDDQLKADFAAWLQTRREHSATRARFTPVDFQRWHRHRALAYIDLTLFAGHQQMLLTDQILANHLFPDDPVADKVRKTVQPLAVELMSPTLIDALEWQTGAKGKLPETILA